MQRVDNAAMRWANGCTRCSDGRERIFDTNVCGWVLMVMVISDMGMPDEQARRIWGGRESGAAEP